MTAVDALELVRSAMWTVIAAAGPGIFAAMVVGVAIALFQALTQVQEVTLTFVPKIIAVVIVCIMTASFIGSQIYSFTEIVYGKIVTGF